MCVCIDGSTSRLQPGWVCLYESRQCARGEQGSEKDVPAVVGERQHQAEGPPSRRQFD